MTTKSPASKVVVSFDDGTRVDATLIGKTGASYKARVTMHRQ